MTEISYQRNVFVVCLKNNNTDASVDEFSMGVDTHAVSNARPWLALQTQEALKFLNDRGLDLAPLSQLHKHGAAGSDAEDAPKASLATLPCRAAGHCNSDTIG